MTTKKEEMQRFARYCRLKEGRDLTMTEVAQFAKLAGWKMPVPKTPLELLAKEFSLAEREEMKYDAELGEYYHANIAYHQKQGDKQLTFWGDIDSANRNKMEKNIVLRRDQMVGDGTQLTIDVKHWNRINPKEEPLSVQLDLSYDVEWRLNAPREDVGVA
ncbi:MAG TPA: hypothetical protein VJT71_15085 [Pyrinomonadaceae bacterium]|nr:hypothetical protein [Pyrinomonadaceae bacterium]